MMEREERCKVQQHLQAQKDNVMSKKHQAVIDKVTQKKPEIRTQSAQTLTWLLQNLNNASSQTDTAPAADSIPMPHHQDVSNQSGAEQQEEEEVVVEEEEEEEEEGEEEGVGRSSCATQVRHRVISVRHRVISAATIFILTHAATWWFGTSLATRMRQKRFCFHRLKYFTCAVDNEVAVEEEHSKRKHSKHLEKELDELKELHGMQDSLHLVRQAARMGDKMLADAKESEADAKEEAGAGLDDTAFQDMARALETAEAELLHLRAHCKDMTSTLQAHHALERGHAQLKVECSRLEGEASKAWQDAREYISSIKTQLEASQ